jgi:hypothetical protein
MRTTTKANLNTVKMIATTLILAEGVTTTLEVKKYLRGKGYRAFQDDISNQLWQIANQEHWLYYDNGMFRIYTFPQIGLLPQ